MTRGGVSVENRTDAAASVKAWAQENQSRIVFYRNTREPRLLGTLGTLGGQTLLAEVEAWRPGFDPAIVLTIEGVPRTDLRITLASALDGGVGTIRQMEFHVASLPRLAARVSTQISAAEQEAAQAREGLAKPFKHADALSAARDHAADIGAQMTAQNTAGADAQETGQTESPGGVTGLRAEAAQHTENAGWPERLAGAIDEPGQAPVAVSGLEYDTAQRRARSAAAMDAHGVAPEARAARLMADLFNGRNPAGAAASAKAPPKAADAKTVVREPRLEKGAARKR